MATGDSHTFPAKYLSVGPSSGEKGVTDISGALVSCQVTMTANLSPGVFTAGSNWQKGNEQTGKRSFVAQTELLLGEFGTATIYGMFQASQDAGQDSKLRFTVQATKGAVSATNPGWHFLAAIPELMPFGDGALESNVMQSFTLTATGEVDVDDGS